MIAAVARVGMARTGPSRRSRKAETSRHEEEALLRPDVDTQAQFRKKKPPKIYRYDSSRSPALDWDGGNWAREYGEWSDDILLDSTKPACSMAHDSIPGAPRGRPWGGQTPRG